MKKNSVLIGEENSLELSMRGLRSPCPLGVFVVAAVNEARELTGADVFNARTAGRSIVRVDGEPLHHNEFVDWKKMLNEGKTIQVVESDDFCERVRYAPGTFGLPTEQRVNEFRL